MLVCGVGVRLILFFAPHSGGGAVKKVQKKNSQMAVGIHIRITAAST
jgi:hypothetical protein